MIRRCSTPCGLATVLLVASGCEEVTTVVQEPTEYVVVLTVSSEVLDQTGDTLVGDSVLFAAAVTRDGQPYTSATTRFESSNPEIVRFLDVLSGEAEFVGAGRAIVSVSFVESEFPDSLLRASLVVPVESGAR